MAQGYMNAKIAYVRIFQKIDYTYVSYVSSSLVSDLQCVELEH